MTSEEKQKLDELLEWKKSLESSNTIPLPVDQAFRSRFSGLLGITTSAKSATSENQVVDEAGVTTYSVLRPPTAFLQVTVNGTIYYIPVY